MAEAKAKDKAATRGGLVSGIILTGIGVLFLLQNFGFLEFSHSWPLILIVIGLALIVGSPRRRKPSRDAVTPGT
ncbi:MAG: DUF5668 domain-containing protein [Candidatus Zixiibacteriota bacterium]